MELLRTIQDCRHQRQLWKQDTLVLVPTMGALHTGHLTLVEHAKQHGNRVVLSIFVNPLQFGPQEDYTRYPRPLEQDLAACESAGVDAVFVPTVEELYPNGQADLTRVLPPTFLTEQLCGLSRPGHFTGVATVVLKLFNILQPDKAVFGEKDAQQLAVLKTMVQDLNVPVEILPAPTVREADGLALSSRNQYLQDARERQLALILSAMLRRVQAVYHQAVVQDKALPAAATLQRVFEESLTAFQTNTETVRLDYFEAVHRDTFHPTPTLTQDTKVLVAARIGTVRLIDNLDLT